MKRSSSSAKELKVDTAGTQVLGSSGNGGKVIGASPAREFTSDRGPADFKVVKVKRRSSLGNQPTSIQEKNGASVDIASNKVTNTDDEVRTKKSSLTPSSSTSSSCAHVSNAEQSTQLQKSKALGHPKTNNTFKSKPTKPGFNPKSFEQSMSPRVEMQVLRLLEAQLGYIEKKTEKSFKLQKEHAEKSLYALWSLVEKKKKELHETKLRCIQQDHEEVVDKCLAQQKGLDVDVLPIVLETYQENLRSMVNALQRIMYQVDLRGADVNPHSLKERLDQCYDQLTSWCNRHNMVQNEEAAVEASRIAKQIQTANKEVNDELSKTFDLIEKVRMKQAKDLSVCIGNLQKNLVLGAALEEQHP